MTSIVVDEVWKRLGNEIRIAIPLGLGKPNDFINELYKRAKDDPSKTLKIYTALSLTPPSAGSNELGKRFLKPFADRMWGANYPKLTYSVDAEANRLPDNIKVHEFYLRAGSALKSGQLQLSYQSINYTHVAEAVFDEKVNLVAQLIAKDPRGSNTYSLGSNPDVTLDLIDLYEEAARPILKVGIVHPDMPYVGGEAVVANDYFDIFIDEPKTHELFALPRMPISDADHAIGFYASQLIVDEGTLQIGIGSLADAVVSALLLRQNDNDNYKTLCSRAQRRLHHECQTNRFEKGLYGLSEMVTDAYMHLRKAGILKREVSDERQRTFLHGAFFLGSKDFYQWLRTLDQTDFSGIRMTRVSKVNDLYDPDEVHLRKQRINARFLNTCMQVTYLGGAASETLEDGRVVSGVGGQYNFVSMSHELKGSRSVLMLRSTRESDRKRFSNIVTRHGHLTIPRHLRDVVVTEYGIANLRNQSDETCIQRLIEIADSEFQPHLIEVAKKSKKIAANYELPADARNNTPARLKEFADYGRALGTFAPFALGSDFTKEEENLALALENLKSLTPLQLAVKALKGSSKNHPKELERMKLEGKSLKEKIYARLLNSALSEL